MKKYNKKTLYESIMASVAKEVKKALNENANENIDMVGYQEWKRENGPYLEKFIKEYLKEHLITTVYCGPDALSIGLDIEGEDFGGSSDDFYSYNLR